MCRLRGPKFEQGFDLSGPPEKQSFPSFIDTGALRLVYMPSNGPFTADNLSIEMTVDGKPVVWHPGLVSRSGWALVDDSTRPLFDSADFSFRQGEKSPWPWVVERPAGERPGAYQDWYFFGYGHDYRKALGDFVRVAGRIPLPPRFAFGAWWSRYWAYSDQELDDIVKGFRQNGVPLDVLVIDMGWHISKEQLLAAGEVDQSEH